MKFLPRNDLPLMDEEQGIVLFKPFIPKNAISSVNDTLNSRWIGQGPKVDLFETKFKRDFQLDGVCMATGSGTDALHLAYLLGELREDDEVIVPLFTCTATNIPLLYQNCKIVFCDVDPHTLNVSVSDLRNKVTDKTKAIVLVHFGGLPCDMEEIRKIADQAGAFIVEDAAHALGSQYDGEYIGNLSEFTMFSFQAIKQLTTGDGGMLVAKDKNLLEKGQRLRWFGIDRSQKQLGIWENDIKEVGYKYQMTDISASLGLSGLDHYPQTLGYRQFLGRRYNKNLKHLSHVNIINDFSPRKSHSYWLYSIAVDNRDECQAMLRANGVESGQTHYRNDRYSIFNSNKQVKIDEYPGMDSIDEKYLILPLHMSVSPENVDYICDLLAKGW